MRHPRRHSEITEARATDCERIYEAAFASGQEVIAAVKAGEADVDRLQGDVDGLELLSTKLKGLQKSLAALYERVFAGPTPEYPEEDDAEGALAAAKYQMEQVRLPS
jgi:hypothetical protein